MCGYCIEYLTCTKLSSLLSGEAIPVLDEYLEAIGYLQEGPDFPSVLVATPSDVAVAGRIPTIIVCRGLEVLMEQGYTSATYQSLLKAPAYLAAVEMFTGNTGLNGHHLEDPRLDLSAWSWLRDEQTYTQDGHLDAQLHRRTMQDGTKLLQQYVEFRLKGIGMCRNDLDERFKQTGVLDPLDDICAEDRVAMAARFPAFWCAMYWLAQQPDGAQPLLEVVTQSPIGVPDFEGLELWLQRRAALITYDQFGLAPFLKNLSSVRTDLFQFIGLMRSISCEDQASLLLALNKLDVTDLEGEHFSLRQWLEKGDLLLAGTSNNLIS